MDETCSDCGGYLGMGAPHECDPGEVELKAHLDKQTAIHNAKERVVEAAVSLWMSDKGDTKSEADLFAAVEELERLRA